MRTKAQPEFTINDLRKAFYAGFDARNGVTLPGDARDIYRAMVKEIREAKAPKVKAA